MTTKGYKGLDKDFKCRDFQYEVGAGYELKGDLKICRNGFHYCENPWDVLQYYSLIGSTFAEVEALGKVEKEEEKSATDKIKIVAKLDLSAFIKAAVEFTWNTASAKGAKKKGHSATSGAYAHSATSGDRANSATSGYGAHSATSGDRANSATSGAYAHSATSGAYAHSATSGYGAHSATSGYGAHSATSGDDAIACSVGRKAAAKGTLGCWIVIAEWKEGELYTDAKPLCVLSARVDGKKIKPDVWYKVENGKFVEESQN